ncbi:MAG: DUF177 domain-containing protein [Gemmatimonadota bacterium]|nr:DUF177 domain-containing protein [Gemmatimonadota bacterium]
MTVLEIDLRRLRSGSYRLRKELDVSEIGFDCEDDLRVSGPAAIDARISTTDKLTYYVSGTIGYRVKGRCRRCLKETYKDKTTELKGLFAFNEALEKLHISENERESEGIFPLERDRKVVDLTDLVRESIVLDYPRFLLCSDKCLGLCPVCGADLNNGSCNCRRGVNDPRWAKLTELKKNK